VLHPWAYNSIGLATLIAVAGQEIAFSDLNEWIHEAFERQRSQAGLRD